LVEESANHERQYVPFTGRQSRVTFAKNGYLGTLETCVSILSQSSLDRSHQIVMVEWLCEKVHCAALDRAHGGRDIAMPGDENNRRMVSVGDLLLQTEAVDIW